MLLEELARGSEMDLFRKVNPEWFENWERSIPLNLSVPPVNKLEEEIEEAFSVPKHLRLCKSCMWTVLLGGVIIIILANFHIRLLPFAFFHLLAAVVLEMVIESKEHSAVRKVQKLVREKSWRFRLFFAPFMSIDDNGEIYFAVRDEETFIELCHEVASRKSRLEKRLNELQRGAGAISNYLKELTKLSTRIQSEKALMGKLEQMTVVLAMENSPKWGAIFNEAKRNL